MTIQEIKAIGLKTLKAAFFTIISIIVIFTIMIIYESVSQKESIKLLSKGDCRIVNINYAYKNNLNFEVHEVKILDNETKKVKLVTHVFAIDDNKNVYDVSNNKEIINMPYNQYMKNVIEDNFLINGSFKNKKIEEITQLNKDTQSYVMGYYIYTSYFVNKILNR